MYEYFCQGFLGKFNVCPSKIGHIRARNVAAYQKVRHLHRKDERPLMLALGDSIAASVVENHPTYVWLIVGMTRKLILRELLNGIYGVSTVAANRISHKTICRGKSGVVA